MNISEDMLYNLIYQNPQTTFSERKVVRKSCKDGFSFLFHSMKNSGKNTHLGLALIYTLLLSRETKVRK